MFLPFLAVLFSSLLTMTKTDTLAGVDCDGTEEYVVPDPTYCDRYLSCPEEEVELCQTGMVLDLNTGYCHKEELTNCNGREKIFRKKQRTQQRIEPLRNKLARVTTTTTRTPIATTTTRELTKAATGLRLFQSGWKAQSVKLLLSSSRHLNIAKTVLDTATTEAAATTKMRQTPTINRRLLTTPPTTARRLQPTPPTTTRRRRPTPTTTKRPLASAFKKTTLPRAYKDPFESVVCEDGEEYLLPDHTYCDRYKSCPEGKVVVCEAGLVFNLNTGFCSKVENTDCKNRDNLLRDVEVEVEARLADKVIKIKKETAEIIAAPYTVIKKPIEAKYPKNRLLHKKDNTARNFSPSSLKNRGTSIIGNRDIMFEDDLSLHNLIFTTISEPIKCQANNELHANPQDCHKYFKCSNGLPSLQSCPTNLVFDSSLNVCNWPESTACVEDTESVLPELVSSHRQPLISRKPPKFTSGIINNPLPAVQQSPSLGPVPTEQKASDREELLINEYPFFKKAKETVRTLDANEVEKIVAKRKENPDNVKRVEFILSEDNYEELFPRRHQSYTYRRFIQAIGIFPSVCSNVGHEEDSDAICRKTLATMFAHFAQETGAHNPSDKEYDEWRQGLSALREQGCTDTSQGCGYNGDCGEKDSITKKWACGKDRSGRWNKYYGRGAKQLSYNFNYGQFSQSMFGDGRVLLDHPDLVAETWLNMASAIWFYATPQSPKPCMLHVIDGTWEPNAEDRRNGIEPGFGATINIINGGLECNTKDGRESKQARNRIKYYEQFAWYLDVDYKNEELGCANQSRFTSDGAGALPIYWDKDWAFPYSCKLVNYQTAHSALVQGEYIDCVEETFNVKIRG